MFFYLISQQVLGDPESPTLKQQEATTSTDLLKTLLIE